MFSSKKPNQDLEPNNLQIEHYKKPRIRSTYFTLGLIIGYLPYCVHQGWIF
jgi:hypothetical protein